MPTLHRHGFDLLLAALRPVSLLSGRIAGCKAFLMERFGQLVQQPLCPAVNLEVTMPCDAIAVAKGQVPLDLARELDGLGSEAMAQALLAPLRQRFAHLGQPELTPLWGAHSGARASGIGVRIGNVLIRVSPDWRVTVNTRRRASAGDDRTVSLVRDAVTGLLNGLAGLTIQQRVAQAVPQAGYRVTDQTRASNGALVLMVEL
jgi:hypothetical protein